MYVNNTYNHSRIHQFLDYVPIASTVKSSAAIFNLILSNRQPTNQPLRTNHTYQKMEDKPLLRTVILIVPFIGNFLIALYDFSLMCISSHYLKKGIKLEKGSEAEKQKALNYFQKAVALKNSEAPKFLAKFLFENRKADFNELYKICIKAAESGDPSYLFKLGERFADEKSLEKDEEKAFNCFLQAAQFGFKEAYFLVSIRFEEGRGVNKCPKSALEWLQKAAEAGNGSACYHLGLLYEKGDLVEKSEVLAVEWFIKAAAFENTDAFKKLASAYFDGVGIAKDEAKGINYYNKAFEAGDTEILIELANKIIEKYPKDIHPNDEKYSYHKMRLEMAIDFLTSSANRRSGLAARRLIEVYGEVRRDNKKLNAWLEKGADLEDVECLYKSAMSHLEHSCDNFYGMTEEILNPEKVKYRDLALSMLEKAANKGHKKSHYELGLLFLERLPIKDEAKGLEWLNKGGEIKCGDCLNKLGNYYQTHTNIPQHLEKAKEFYHRASELIPDSYFHLCLIFLDENPLNVEKILEHLKKGADCKSVKCLLTLGSIYLGKQVLDEKQWDLKNRVPEDRATAIDYLERAFNLENDSSLAKELAELFEEGKNGEKAVQYYELASQIPQEMPTMYDIGRIFEEGTIIKKDLRKAFYYYSKDTSQDLRCNLKLARMYEYGISGYLAINLEKAFAEYHAASGRSSLAMLKKANMYESGKGAPQNPIKAEKWYRLAAAAGETEAVAWLSKIVPQDVDLPT